MPAARASRACAAAWAAALAWAAASALLAWWVVSDKTPPSFDEAWYLENSYRFFHALRSEGLAAFARAWAESFRFKAPLISALPLPLYPFLGLSYETAVLANIPALALLAYSLYRLGKRFGDAWTGALAAALALANPLSAALARHYFVETWSAALLAATALAAVESEGLRRLGAAPRLGLLAGLGLLTKVLFPLHAAGLLAYTLLERARHPVGPDWRGLEKPLKMAFLFGAPVALSWYAFNWVPTLAFALKAGFGDIAGHYGSARVWAPSVLLGYWGFLAREAFSPPLLLALSACAAVLLLKHGRRALEKTWADPGALLALLWLALPLAVTSFGVCKDQRFMAPILPAAALLAALGLKRAFPRRAARAALSAASLLLLSDQCVLQALGRSPLGVAGLARTGLLAARSQYALAPARGASLGQAELLDWVLARLGEGAAVVSVGTEHPILNANLLAALAAERSSPARFVNSGFMESRVERAVARLSDKDVTHLLFIEGLPASERTPKAAEVEAALLRLVQTGLLPFARAGGFGHGSPDGAGLRAELWEKRGPLRMLGAWPEAARSGKTSRVKPSGT